MPRHALISGASVAGPALAHQLAARGWRTTVVERYPRLRDEGQNIDVRGAGEEVLRHMDIEDAVKAAGTGEVGMRFVGRHGRTVAEFPVGEGSTVSATAEVEILRGELSRILYDRTHERTEYRFDEQIRDLQDHGDHVTATLDGGDRIDADLVVVAEGARSRTRARIFDEIGVDELGLFIAHATIPRTAGDDRWWHWYGAPGSRTVSLRPDNVGTTRAMLSFLSNIRGLESLERDAQVMMLRRTFADAGWQTPRILAALDDAPLYVDAVVQVRLPRWSRGRVVLLGDAAWSPGPFGTGTTLALVGAYVLAGELATHDDVGAALERYEAVLRPFAAAAQNVHPAALRAMNPRTTTGLAVQRAALRVVGPVTSALSRISVPSFRTPADAVELPRYPAPVAL